jgi:signal transduction histidine kinase
MFVVDTAMTLLMRALAAEEVAKANLREVSKHKSDFLASMSHELRTPLNAIIGFSDVLAAQHFGPLNERQLDHVADVQEAGRHLLELINDVLDMSKIEAGSIELEKRVFPLADTIGAAVNFIAPRAAANQINVSVDVAPEANEAFGDERRIKQVLANLLSNAVKFTRPGGSIAVTADADEFATTVAVTDDGVGIAPDDLERIFDEFQQAGDVHTAMEGTGLGLALSRRLLELHSGSIKATSEVGRGSTFSFSIPRQPTAVTA